MNKSLLFALWIVLGVGLAAATLVSMRAAVEHSRTSVLMDQVDAAIIVAQDRQQTAALANITGTESRRAARRDNTPESVAIATQATSAERAAHAIAADAWEVADAAIDDALTAEGAPLDAASRKELRRLRNRARIGMGDLAGAAEDLERMLKESVDAPDADPNHRVRTREDLVMAYYHAARLMRLRGDPERVWRLVSERARQHARVLAEGADPVAGELGAKTRRQRNLEIIMDFERMPLDMLEAEALPEDCPGGNCKKLNLDSWPWMKRGKKSNGPDGPKDDRGFRAGAGAGAAGGGG